MDQKQELPLLKQVIDFWRKPDFDKYEYEFVDRIYITLAFSILFIIITILATFLAIPIMEMIARENPNGLIIEANPDLVEKASFFVLQSGFEGMFFRLFLSDHFLTSLFGLGCFSVSSFSFIHQNSSVAFAMPGYLGIAFVTFCCIGLMKNKEFFKLRLRLISVASAILFGFAHITTFDQVKNNQWLLTLLVIYLVIIGYLLNFIRVKYGFIQSVIVHISYNLLLFTFFTTVQKVHQVGLFTNDNAPESLIVILFVFLGIAIPTEFFGSYSLYLKNQKDKK